MVSIRRRRLLGLCSARRNSLLGTLSLPVQRDALINNKEITESISVHPLPSNGGQMPKQVSKLGDLETNLESDHVSADLIAYSPLKEHHFLQFPEVKHRKPHRRKHAENEKPCTMRGVYYKNRKWQAAIKVDKKQIHLGTVGSEEEAARLYDRAAFMCRRKPNFDLSEEEKKELSKYRWEEFLAVTRSAITNKSARELMRVSRTGKPDDLLNSVFGGFASGALLGRLQGGLVGAARYAVMFSVVGTAFDYANLNMKSTISKYIEKKDNWLRLPEWSPIQILDDENVAAKRAREQEIFKNVQSLHKEDS